MPTEIYPTNVWLYSLIFFHGVHHVLERKLTEFDKQIEYFLGFFRKRVNSGLLVFEQHVTHIFCRPCRIHNFMLPLYFLGICHR